MYYSKIIITNLPSFYKINLYNRINRVKKVFVVFTGDTAEMRESDFFSGEIEFEHISLQNNSIFQKLYTVYCIIRNNNYDELIISEYSELISWLCAFISPKKKNATVVESSIYESTVSGYKGLLKKIFFKRFSVTYASGKSQEKLVRNLNFNGKIVITKGVGIFNIIEQPKFIRRNEVSNFIYIGRLSPEKNLIFLINVFKNFPQLKLHIVGYGPQEPHLKKIAGSNVIFHGAVENKKIPSILQMCDVLILPSIKEPWGLVVEEALNNGLPVIVSNKVGCAEEIIEAKKNGLIFIFDSSESLIIQIKKIIDTEFYNSLKYNISKMDFKSIADFQVRSYIILPQNQTTCGAIN